MILQIVGGKKDEKRNEKVIGKPFSVYRLLLIVIFHKHSVLVLWHKRTYPDQKSPCIVSAFLVTGASRRSPSLPTLNSCSKTMAHFQSPAAVSFIDKKLCGTTQPLSDLCLQPRDDLIVHCPIIQICSAVLHHIVYDSFKALFSVNKRDTAWHTNKNVFINT